MEGEFGHMQESMFK